MALLENFNLLLRDKLFAAHNPLRITRTRLAFALKMPKVRVEDG